MLRRSYDNTPTRPTFKAKSVASYRLAEGESTDTRIFGPALSTKAESERDQQKPLSPTGARAQFAGPRVIAIELGSIPSTGNGDPSISVNIPVVGLMV